jgi:lysophospholipase L1-like esterase
MRRIVSALGAVVLVMILLGCTSNNANNTLPVPAIRTYTAIGASDAVGVGAIQCPTAGVPPMPSPPSCPGGNGYVPVLAGLLTGPHAQVNLFNLGISGAVIGPDIQADTALCFGAPGNFITNQLPLVNAQSNIVTIFAGGNDTNAIVACAVGIAMGGGNPQPFILAEIAKFGADYTTLVQGIKAASPSATIVVANLPNFALIPVGRTQPPGVQALLAEVSIALDTQVINPLLGNGVAAVVDLRCDPRSYNPANFSADGFHPDAAGYQILANSYYNQLFLAQLGLAPKPQPSCSPFSAAAAHPASLSRADAAGAHLWRY